MNTPKTVRTTEITAHAGCQGWPANSLASIRRILTLPVDSIEVDVRFTVVSTPYIGHDLLNGSAQLLAPALEAVLDLIRVRPDVRVNLDLKEYVNLPGLAEQVRAAGMTGRVWLTGLWAKHQAAARAAFYPDMPYYLNARPVREMTRPELIPHLVERIQLAGACGLCCWHRLVTPALVQALHQADLKISVWTVDHPADQRRMLELGVDNITTDRVDRLLNLMKRHGHSTRGEGYTAG